VSENIPETGSDEGGEGISELRASVFFSFQFPDGTRVASIPRQIQTDFARLATLFQGTLKTAGPS
jgi:hypothetical protein